MLKYRFLSGNALKILAAVCMVVDHVGLMFFPAVTAFRIIGRLAFPIFAFFISEGARYTKNKLRYFLTMFLLGFICQVVYFFFDNGSLYMCILITFSLSVAMIYALNWFKKCLFSADVSPLMKLLSGAVFVGSIIGVYILNRVLTIDYGFLGCMAPVFASLFDMRGIEVSDSIKRLDRIEVRILMLGVGLLLLSLNKGYQIYSLLALIPLLLYSGERGKFKMKYFFYIFYPLHLVLLEGIYILTR